MEEEKKQLTAYEDGRYQRSNFLIGMKYKSTLLEDKIMAISLVKMQRMEYTEDNGGLVCRLHASELRKLLHANEGSFYSTLEPVAQQMTARTIGWSDPEKNEFEYISVITKASYKDGVFTIRYNSDLKKYLKDLKSNYTLLNLPTMLSFKSVYTFRIFELLKSRAYYPKGQEREDEYFKIHFSLSELKLEIGVVNAELDSVRKVLNHTGAPDYDKAVERSPEKTFNRWSDFKRRVLDVAAAEINEKTDMEVTFEAEKAGRGAKVVGVVFYVQLNKFAHAGYEKQADRDLDANIVDADLDDKIVDDDKNVELSDDDKLDFYVTVRQLVDEKIPIKDVKAISEASNYDIDKVRNAYRIMSKSRKRVENVTGFLISAIKNEYSTPVAQEPTESSPKSKANFTERNYSDAEMDALQKKLLMN